MLTRNALRISMTLATMVAACGGSGAECPEGMVKRGDVCATEDARNNERSGEPSTVSDGDTDGGQEPSMDASATPDRDTQPAPPEDGAMQPDVSCLRYRDQDGDGHGDKQVTTTDCNQVAGWADKDDDCRDDDNTTYTGARELCDGRDNDCNDAIDDDAKVPLYADCDKDGFADKTAPQNLCRGTVPQGSKCAWIEREPVDENSTDCNDGEFNIKPTAQEVCDNIDNNCRGGVDEEQGVEGALKKVYYTDEDGDGYGVTALAFGPTCTQPAKTSPVPGDCQDDPARGGFDINPIAEEVCDYLDNNCRDGVDEGVQNVDWFADCDGDGHIASGTKQQRKGCAVAPTGGLSCGGISGQQWMSAAGMKSDQDCDDSSATRYPGAPEICDEAGFNDSCKPGANDALKVTFVLDCDGDGWAGKDAKTKTQCATTPKPAATCGAEAQWLAQSVVKAGIDCRDDRKDTHPGQKEICDEGNLDHDCNPDTSDEGLKTTYFADCDGDGHLRSSPQQLRRCTAPASGEASCPGTNGTAIWRRSDAGHKLDDCADLDSRAHPGAFPGALDYGVDQPVNGGTTNGFAYDYNCNNSHELEPRFWPACTAGTVSCESSARCIFALGDAWTCGNVYDLRTLTKSAGPLIRCEYAPTQNYQVQCK